MGTHETTVLVDLNEHIGQRREDGPVDFVGLGERPVRGLLPGDVLDDAPYASVAIQARDPGTAHAHCHRIAARPQAGGFDRIEVPAGERILPGLRNHLRPVDRDQCADVERQQRVQGPLRNALEGGVRFANEAPLVDEHESQRCVAEQRIEFLQRGAQPEFRLTQGGDVVEHRHHRRAVACVMDGHLADREMDWCGALRSEYILAGTAGAVIGHPLVLAFKAFAERVVKQAGEGVPDHIAASEPEQAFGNAIERQDP